MHEVFWLIEVVWRPALLACLAGVASVGIVAAMAPSLFRRICEHSGRQLDLSRLCRFLERPIDVDQYLIRHPRLLGLASIASCAVLAYLLLLVR